MTFDLSLPSEFRNAEIALLAAALNDGTRELRDEFGEVTPEELAYTPVSGRYNAAAVILHHAAVEDKWIRCDLFGESREESDSRFPLFTKELFERGEWPDLGGLTLQEIYRRSDEVRRETLARLALIEDAAQPTVTSPEWRETARWVVNHLIGHESYHYGQAVLLVEMARATGRATIR